MTYLGLLLMGAGGGLDKPQPMQKYTSVSSGGNQEGFVRISFERPWRTARNLHFNNILNGLIKKKQMVEVCHFRENNKILHSLICLFFTLFPIPSPP